MHFCGAETEWRLVAYMQQHNSRLLLRIDIMTQMHSALNPPDTHTHNTHPSLGYYKAKVDSAIFHGLEPTAKGPPAVHELCKIKANRCVCC